MREIARMGLGSTRKLTEKLRIIFIAVLVVGFVLFSLVVSKINRRVSLRHDEQLIASNGTYLHAPIHHPSIDETWFQRREEMLSENDVRKILFFAYMRGGSTIGSRLFNEDPDAVLWKEPLGPFYSAYYGLHSHTVPQHMLYNTAGDMSKIIFQPEEQQLMANYFKEIFECQYDRLPPQIWLHQFITMVNSVPISKGLRVCRKKYDDRDFTDHCGNIKRLCWKHMAAAKINHCKQIVEMTRDLIDKSTTETSDHEIIEKLQKRIMSNYSTDPEVTLKKIAKKLPAVVKMERCAYKIQTESISCLKEASELCKESNLQVADTNRIKMDEVESILQANPDVFVIHYIRDPRGIALSRNTSGWWALLRSGDESIYYEADFLCQRMREDLRIRHQLQARFPGVFLQIRYEDFILDPMGTASRIYQFVGREFPSTSGWQKFVDVAFHAEKDMGNLLRVNATKSIDRWKTAIPAIDLERIKHVCSDVLMEFGYPL